MSIENKLLLKIIETKDWETVMDKGITSNYFTGSNKRAFKWIGDFKVNYGTIPEADTFKKHFPEVSLNVEAKENIGYYCDEVRKKIRQNKLVAVLDKAPDKINNGDVDGCYEDLGKLLLEVNAEFTFTEKVDIGKNALQRFEDYQNSKLTGGMTGYSIGIKPIDKQTGGMKDVDLFTFLASSGKGKSWLLCIIASKLIKAGYRVLFLTKEMSPNQILKRMDAIMANVSYSRFKSGNLTPAEEEQYRIYLEQYAPRYTDRLSIEMILNGVNECIAKVDSYQPDVLLVDGGYLMAEGADPEDWKAVLSVWKAFKVMALGRKIPVIITSQLTDKGSVAYATSLKQYCDGIWCMKQDDVQKASREISIETLKIRDGEHITPFTMSWDFTEPGGFGEVLFETFDNKNGFFTKEEPNSLVKI